MLITPLPHSRRFLAIAGAAPASPTVAQLTIDVRNFAFNPSPIHLAAGRPVTLTFVNRSGSNHDFTARAFSPRHRSAPALRRAARSTFRPMPCAASPSSRVPASTRRIAAISAMR